MMAASFSSGDLVIVIIVFLLLSASGFFALAETALVRTSRQRAQGLRDGGGAKPRQIEALVKLVEHPERFFNPLLLLVLTTQLVSATLVGLLADHWFGAWGVGLAAVFEVIVIFVFFEAVPKNYALRNSDRAALGAARTVGLLLAFPPIRWSAAALIWLADRVLGRHGIANETASVSEHELLAMASQAATDKVIEEVEREIIHSVLEFTDTVVREIMIPRPDMVAADDHASVAEVINMALAAGVTRVPIYDEDEDDVIGIAILKDLVAAERLGRGGELASAIARAPQFVPETMKLQPLLNAMREGRNHLAIAIDEYGSTAGLVTMEDVLEELVGEIADEHDSVASANHELVDAFRLFVSGRLTIDELDDLDSTGASKLPQESWDTVGGLIMDRLGHVPEEGESVEVDGLTFTTLRVEARRISWVEVVSPEPIFPLAESTPR